MKQGNEIPRDSRELDLSHRSISMTQNYFEGMNLLERLNLSSMGLTTLPASIFSLPSIVDLDISNNLFELFPPALGKLPKLQRLNISNNPFSDTYPLSKIKASPTECASFYRQLASPKPTPPLRKFFPSPPPKHKNCFSVLTYNILAPSCVHPQYFPFCPPELLDPLVRLPQILDQILENHPDIVCLQEVEADLFISFFVPNLLRYGYNGTFCPKGRQRTQIPEKQLLCHGEATFLKTDRFKVLSHKSVEFRTSRFASGMPDFFNKFDDTALISVISPSSRSDINIILANIHLFWDAKQDSVRLGQLLVLMEEIASIHRQSPKSQDIIIAGDFNANYSTPSMEYLFSRPEHLICVFNSLGIKHPITQYHIENPQSIDHIVSTQENIHPFSVLQTDDSDYIKNEFVHLPGEHFPSDHVQLMTYFKFHVNKPMDSGHNLKVSKRETKPLVIVMKPSKSE